VELKLEMENSTFYGVIYKITCLINNKVYVGQSKNPKERWRQHKINSKNNSIKTAISNAILKYSIENFVFEIIDSSKSAKELNLLEEKYIKELNSLCPKGYNIIEYNNGIKIISEDAKNKISEFNINNKKENCSSNYHGVCYDKQSKVWISSVAFKGNRTILGRFDSEIDAAMARDIDIIKGCYSNAFKLNFPELKEDYLNNTININRIKNKKTSKYTGVYLKYNKWGSYLSYNKKRIHLGTFNSEKEAAMARDIEVIKPEYNGVFELNFPELRDQYFRGEIIINKINSGQQGKKKHKNASSNYVGVHFNKKNKYWGAMISYKDKRCWIGSFTNEIDAAIAYDNKAIELFGCDAVTNF
jgi:group I intron endonuclease